MRFVHGRRFVAGASSDWADQFADGLVGGGDWAQQFGASNGAATADAGECKGRVPAVLLNTGWC